MLGLARSKVHLIPHQVEWSRLFADEAAELRAALGARAARIEHVGSTSIPGLEAKPIIDIVIAVDSFPYASQLVPQLESLGYTHRPEGDLESRLFLTKGPDDAVTHHLSLTEEGSPSWVDHVDFRDFLRASAWARNQYLTLKRVLAASYADDRPTYTAKKADFIRHILDQARAVHQA